jgi:sugar phosphate isomerase/epimerase
MKNRRNFLKNTIFGAAALSLPSSLSYGAEVFTGRKELRLSLAQWSLHRSLEQGEVKAVDFPGIAKKSYGISAVEYVNQFYSEQAANQKFWSHMKDRADDEDVKSLLIMVDNEGDLGNPDDAARKTAVENHYKWIHAAKILGCHSIRVNAFGKGTREELHKALVNGLGQLALYGQKEEIHILIENHGLHTSDAQFIVAVIREVDNPYLGTLPDFGNWCLNVEWGSIQNDQCENIYDPKKGVSEFLPFARGVSAKSYAFDADGNETMLDYPNLLRIVKNSDFKGHIGIEYEGEILSEAEGIRATKALIEKLWAGID